MSIGDADLKSIIMNFRVAELTQLLAFCDQSRLGRKAVLQCRALQLIEKGNLTLKIQAKIRELNILRSCSTTGIRENQEQAVTQDGSSSECLPTDSEMAHLLTNNVQMPEYFSMPKPFAIQGNICEKKNNSQPNLDNKMIVKFKSLPFYDVHEIILKPNLILQNSYTPKYSEMHFSLSVHLSDLIAVSRELKKNGKYESKYQIQLRACELDVNSVEQEDSIPMNISIKVNSKEIFIPNYNYVNKLGEPKKITQPIDISQYCKLSPFSHNMIVVSMERDYNVLMGKTICIAVFLSEKLSTSKLIGRLTPSKLFDPLITKNLICSKLKEEDECEILTTTLKANLRCPLGKMRIRVPVRGIDCTHVQCFDAEFYLQMNEKKPNWICPVCDKKTSFNSLFVDGLFQNILNQVSENANEIEFTKEGDWKLPCKKEESKKCTIKRKLVDIDNNLAKKNKAQNEIILIDSSDEDEGDSILEEILDYENSQNGGVSKIPSFNKPTNTIPSYSTDQMKNASLPYNWPCYESLIGSPNKQNLNPTQHPCNFGTLNNHYNSITRYFKKIDKKNINNANDLRVMPNDLYPSFGTTNSYDNISSNNNSSEKIIDKTSGYNKIRNRRTIRRPDDNSEPDVISLD